MVPKSRRLNLRLDFKMVASGSRVETTNLKIFFVFNDGEPKVGVSIPSKIFKNAVQRNRARRIVYSALSKLYPLLKRGLYLIIMPKVGVLGAGNDGVFKELGDVKDIINPY